MKRNSNLHKLDKCKTVIPIQQFIINYLNDGIDVVCYDLTHKDLKKFSNPYVVTIPFEFAEENMDSIYTGRIILVRDVLGNIAPYINPEYIRIMKQEEHVNLLQIERTRYIKRLLEDLNNYLMSKKERNDFDDKHKRR